MILHEKKESIQLIVRQTQTLKSRITRVSFRRTQSEIAEFTKRK